MSIKELTLPPEDLMVEGERVNGEYTLIINRLEFQYLPYLLWYCRTFFLEWDPKLDDAYRPPIVCSRYDRDTKRDLTVEFRSFSHLWRMYDWVEGKSPGWYHNVLTEGRKPGGRTYVLSSSSGTMFVPYDDPVNSDREVELTVRRICYN
jgi:hypothetical protein